MDFREINYVVTIAKCKNLSKAAKELYVTQPTLSKFVQNLEKELGQPLFQRRGNYFDLTYAGERYVEKAKAILAIKKEIDEELMDIVKRDVGELRIAFPIMRGNYMLPCTLPVFQKKYPNVNVYVQEANSDHLESMLLDGEIDIAFFTLPIQDSNLDYDVISHEEVVLVMSKENPLSQLGCERKECDFPWVDIKEFVNERFILQRPVQRTRIITDKLFKKAGISIKPTLEIRNILASVKLASEGFGVTLVGETHLRHVSLEKPIAVFSVGEPRTTTYFVAAYRKGVYLPNYAKDFIKIVKELT